MRTVAAACLAVLLFAAAACASTPTDSGISGLVTIGPISPVEQPGQVNEKPYSATLLIKTSAGRTVAEVTSGTDGHFKVDLKPGRYVLEPQSERSPPYAAPQDVLVQAHRFTEVAVSYDSGIR